MTRRSARDILLLFWLFVAVTTVNSEKCPSRKLTGRSGTITTRNFPNAYPNHENCIWTITVTKGYYVRLTFETFDVELYEDCKTDVLEIKDGGDKDAPLIGGQYCNFRQPPKVVTSSSNQMRLWFNSDSTIQGKGFKAKYEAILDAGCGGSIIATNGEITSPRFPLHYPRKQTCRWNVEVPKGKFASLTFEFFEVETKCNFQRCQCLDWVQIIDRKTNKEIGKYCFIAPPPIVTSGNELSIIFHSDDFGRLKGFKAAFTQSTTEKCGGDLVAPNGTIQLSAQDGTYNNLMYCIWTITAPKNEYISLQFQYIDVKTSRKQDCSADYIEIRNGPDLDSPLLGRYCNIHKPDVLVSTGEKMFIRFNSDNKVVGKGFSLTYRTHTKSCSSSLGMEDERITEFYLLTSSFFKIAHEPHKLDANYGRLNGPYAWCSQEQRTKDGKNVAEYFQINFKKFTKVTKVATQGYSMVGNSYYVTKYKLEYVMGNNQLHPYATLEDSKRGSYYTVFNGNNLWNVTKENTLQPTIVAKGLRIIPLEYASGRRPHICMRSEVYGCQIPTDTTILTKPKSVTTFASTEKSSKTWLISVGGRNSVYLFHLVKAGTRCDACQLAISYDGLRFSNVKDHCSNTVRRQVEIYPSTRQLWVKFDINKVTTDPQEVQFTHSLQNLGHGRVITSPHGTIQCLHNEVAKLNETSVWLFKFPDSYHIDVEFLKVRMPSANKENPSIVVRNGLEDSSSIVRKLVGKQPNWAFVQKKSILRIEYHVGLKTNGLPPNGRYRDGFKVKYQAWAVETKHNKL